MSVTSLLAFRGRSLLKQRAVPLYVAFNLLAATSGVKYLFAGVLRYHKLNAFAAYYAGGNARSFGNLSESFDLRTVQVGSGLSGALSNSIGWGW